LKFNLPYEGYSWSMTQHIAPATDSATMYELLNAAYIFSGDSKYRELITDHMIEKDLLTPNIRADQEKPQLWRDYQQVLPELGLIFSTRFTNSVKVTPIGLMWLDGIIGYSELISTQCLRIQYPNGHKQNISPGLKQKLRKNSVLPPNTRTELDWTNGILIKPGVLILRILIELSKKGNLEGISIEECGHFLLPSKRNDVWDQVLFQLLKNKIRI